MRQLRGNISAEELQRASSATSEHLIQYVRSQGRQSISAIAVYAAVGGEISLEVFSRWAQSEGKVIAFPVLEPWPDSQLADQGRRHHGMFLQTWEANATFQQGPFKIPEPVGGDRIAFEECDLVLTPGVAFSRAGERLGRGKGYYDKALSFLTNTPRPAKTKAIGICHDFQIIPNVPTTASDILMDGLASPTGLVWHHDCHSRQPKQHELAK